ncbi:MAG: hypothetical protein ABIK09_07300 [Pseudomonadota bacterium]
MRTCAALITVNDPLLMDCVLARVRPCLDSCRGEMGSHSGAAYFDGDVPVLLMEPARGAGRPTLRLPNRVLSRQFFTCTLNGAETFRAQDTPPFRFRTWVLVSGGVLGTAAQAADQLAIPRHISRGVQGSTSAEQLLHQYVSFLQSATYLAPNQRMRGYRDALRSTLSLDDQWFPDEGSRDVTVLLGDGRRVVGATLGRPLWYEHIAGIDACLDCGCGLDGQPLEHAGLRATTIVDSVLKPGDGWQVIEQNHVFSVDRAGEIEIAPMSRAGGPAG